MRKEKGWKIGVAAFFAGLILMGSNPAGASDCYQLFYNWDCIEDLNFDKSDIILEWKTALISKHKDGTIKWDGEFLGAWGILGTSFYIDSYTNFYIDNEGTIGDCRALFTGNKSYYGFFVCRSGVNANKPPGCWLMLKLKPKDCPWITEKEEGR